MRWIVCGCLFFNRNMGLNFDFRDVKNVIMLNDFEFICFIWILVLIFEYFVVEWVVNIVFRFVVKSIGY